MIVEKFISVIPASLVLIVSLLPIDFVNWITLYILISDRTRKTPEGLNGGCVGVSKNYLYVEWQWKVE